MKISFTHFSAEAPIRTRYEQGVDFLVQDFDLEFDQALFLLKGLKNHRSRLSVEAPACNLNFYVESNGSLRVEIYGNNGLWADSEVDIGGASEIFRMASEGAEFGASIPGTDRQWDAYSGI